MGKRKEHIIENDIEKKHCPTCDKLKELLEFNKQSSSWDKLARMCRQCYCDYKNNKRKNDPIYREKDMIYNENYKSSGRRKEVSAIRYINKREQIIKQCIEYNKKKYIHKSITKTNHKTIHKQVCYKIHMGIRKRIDKSIHKRIHK